MDVLYGQGSKRFIVKNNNKYFLVSLGKQEAFLIDEMTAQSILRQGYWNANPKVIEDTIAEISKVINSNKVQVMKAFID